jgi:hypothetical protein
MMIDTTTRICFTGPGPKSVALASRDRPADAKPNTYLVRQTLLNPDESCSVDTYSEYEPADADAAWDEFVNIARQFTPAMRKMPHAVDYFGPVIA